MLKIKNTIILMAVSGWKILLLALLGVLSGFTGFYLIFTINRITSLLLKGQLSSYNAHYFLVLFLTIAAFVLSRRVLARQVIGISQGLFWNIRERVSALLIRSTYSESQDWKNELYSAIHHDAVTLTAGSNVIINLLTNLILVVSAIVYMAFLSLPLFGFSMAALVVGISIYQWRLQYNNRHFSRSRKLEADFLTHFDALFFGLKEVQMEPRKGADINHRKIRPVSKEARQSDTSGYVGYLNSMILGQFVFYVLIGLNLLYLGFLFHIPGNVLVNFSFLSLFILGPIENIMLSIPILSKAVISLSRMLDLIEKLGEKVRTADEKKIYEPIQFSSLRISGLEYQYPGEDKFRMGPVYLDIHAGEIIFIYGGNGSGKSTFIKVLLQLYTAFDGAIQLNGERISDANQDWYRRHFGVVFSDFHLFDELYGLADISSARVREYLELFEIDGKVTFSDNKFSSINLSTGQRKRLAIIEALLGNKPVLVLDEWAADQDPAFRNKFYKVILPMLKDRGITIIAITHDDAYYHCADRVFKMDFGRLEELSWKAPAEPDYVNLQILDK